MKEEKFNTLYAPAEKASGEKVLEDNLLFPKEAPLFNITNSIPSGVLVLNKERQIVFVNNPFLKFLNLEDDVIVLGKRPGEVLNCIHAFETNGGCGTTEFCKTCGAVKSILEAQKGKENTQECRITERNHGNSFDLRIWSTPLKYNNQDFVIFSIQDIQDEKRRKILERIFFHDILNTASGLKGISDTLEDAKPDEASEFIEILGGLSDRLIDEIKAQRELLSAENNEYQVDPKPIYTETFLEEISRFHSRSNAAFKKKIIVNKNSSHIKIFSDKTMLWRVVSNTVKNALEASVPGEEIKIECTADDSFITFLVHNPVYINRNIQLQIFQRSFSSKGVGRGLGTYSIKLLTERYLKGTVGFSSDETDGTTFFIKIPIDLKL